MLLAFASYSACSRSSSDNRMVKFFLGSINCPLRPISNPFFRFFFIRHQKFPFPARFPKLVQIEFARYVKRHAFYRIRLGGFLHPPKTLCIYAPDGAGIGNTLCTTCFCLYYNGYYHKIIRMTPGITFPFFVLPGVLTSHILPSTNLT